MGAIKWHKQVLMPIIGDNMCAQKNVGGSPQWDSI